MQSDECVVFNMNTPFRQESGKSSNNNNNNSNNNNSNCNNSVAAGKIILFEYNYLLL